MFLLAKDVDGVLELCESCPFSIDVLPPGLGTLGCCLPSGGSFLLQMKPFHLLLNSSELCFFCNFILPNFKLMLIKFCMLLDDLNWRRCS
jgi:hypothetical protein